MIDSSYVQIAGLRTHYLHAGSGALLLLLHGQTPGSCARVEWARTVEHFARAGYEVYAPDQAGFGRTENPSDYSMEYRLHHIKSFVDHVAPERYAVWGCSMGSYIGALLALSDSRVDRLAVMPNSHLAPDLPTASSDGRPRMGDVLRAYEPSLENARAVLEAIVFDRCTLTEELVREFYEASTGEKRDADRGRRLAPKPRPIFEDLKHLSTPTLILWGYDDTPTAVERASRLLDLIPSADLVVLRRCGHWPQYDRFERTNELIDNFVKGAQ